MEESELMPTVTYKCYCKECGKQFATNKSIANWVIVVCPNPECRSKQIEFSDYDERQHMNLPKV